MYWIVCSFGFPTLCRLSHRMEQNFMQKSNNFYSILMYAVFGRLCVFPLKILRLVLRKHFSTEVSVTDNTTAAALDGKQFLVFSQIHTLFNRISHRKFLWSFEKFAAKTWTTTLVAPYGNNSSSSTMDSGHTTKSVNRNGYEEKKN